jgi:hypothetical protein
MLNNIPRSRGRDRDLIYLLQLAKKHDLSLTGFHDSLLVAERRGKTRCKGLQIEIRSRGEEYLTYMFSAPSEPLAQATIQRHSIRKLKKLPAEYSSLMQEDDKRRDSGKMGAPFHSDIANMRFGQDGLSFKAHVVKKSEVRAVTTRDGTPILVCSVTLSDGTGQIPLAVWNNQISTISEGDLVEVHNARVRNFRGEIQLSLSRKTGVLTVLEAASKGKQAIPA